MITLIVAVPWRPLSTEKSNDPFKLGCLLDIVGTSSEVQKFKKQMISQGHKLCLITRLCQSTVVLSGGVYQVGVYWINGGAFWNIFRITKFQTRHGDVEEIWRDHSHEPTLFDPNPPTMESTS